MKKIFVNSVYCVFIILLINCGEPIESIDCPTIYDNITWKSYGSYKIHHVGSDKVARAIISECGWHVYNGHNGGYGDTLEIASAAEEVIFVWTYNSFSGFIVTDGWQGATEKGATIGSDLTDFLTKHPEFHRWISNYYEYKFDGGYIWAIFDQNGFLQKLGVFYL